MPETPDDRQATNDELAQREKEAEELARRVIEAANRQTKVDRVIERTSGAMRALTDE